MSGGRRVRREEEWFEMSLGGVGFYCVMVLPLFLATSFNIYSVLLGLLSFKSANSILNVYFRDKFN